MYVDFFISRPVAAEEDIAEPDARNSDDECAWRLSLSLFLFETQPRNPTVRSQWPVLDGGSIANGHHLIMTTRKFKKIALRA
jgi:hypothetical protein